MKKFIFGALGALGLVGIIAGASYIRKLDAKAKIGVSYKTKIVCSEVFVAGRDLDEVLARDFKKIDPLLAKVKLRVDREAGTVTGSLLGLGKSTALYRPHAGCTGNAGGGVTPVNIPAPNPVPHDFKVAVNPDVQNALLRLFADDELPNPLDTRGALVIQNGEIIAEHYAPGFDETTRQQSWSMAKSVTSALVGVLADKGDMSWDETGLHPDWADDARHDIALSDLLQMSSGLASGEDYGDPKSQVVQMLFNGHDTAGFAPQSELTHPVGTHFEYASATTNFLSGLIRERVGNDAAYHAFPRQALFDPLGMETAVFETDPAGTFIGSSYLYASPRDFARFGLLYLQNGQWNGRSVLSEAWIAQSLTPADSTQDYGAQWWLNAGLARFPDLPRDVAYMGGHDGQYVVLIPSKNAVIVRMGIMREPAGFEADMYPLLRDVYRAIPSLNVP